MIVIVCDGCGTILAKYGDFGNIPTSPNGMVEQAKNRRTWGTNGRQFGFYLERHIGRFCRYCGHEFDWNITAERITVEPR